MNNQTQRYGIIAHDKGQIIIPKLKRRCGLYLQTLNDNVNDFQDSCMLQRSKNKNKKN